MRRKDREIIDISEIEQIIAESQVCHVAMFDEDYPYIVTLNFGYINETNPILYFHSAPVGKKIDLIIKNSNVCFQFDTKKQIITGEKACDFTMKFKSVVGVGKMMNVESESEKILGLDLIMKQYSDLKHFEYKAEMLKRTSILKIEVEKMTGKSNY